ncbi:hypothetical protein BFW01_g5993 [Lasiodiplodia theobromae]|uniref:uncharacterized protein n=1 Tax=Lasiodiplodia theobromae TaxID=45133 RepID=UPI0015C36383|nr:uncharacterized protein LTHEOB_4690 [Lasiodiplodia theobromae]KAF4546038.1 hypothetical protein LTHEOB_4690 [Lasiodiplodia theobromae]KAF9635098.1 hypothetical protein BFW01_g5993 [Lasiodiplodia theobromae]
MYFSKATIIAVAALLSTGYALPAATGSCPDQAAACRSSGGSGCDAAAKSCCDSTIPVVSPKSDGDHYQCYQDSGIGSMLQRRDPGDECATTANSCRATGGSGCDDAAASCCDKAITVVSPKSDGDHYQCYKNAGIESRLNKRDAGDDCAAAAKSCRATGGASCDDTAAACCDKSIPVVSPKSDGDHWQCYQDAGIGSRLSKRDIGPDCAASAKSCRSTGASDCDNKAKTCCDQIQVVSPKSDGDHWQCYQDAGIGSMLSQ